MHVLYGVICEEAREQKNGRLDLNGVFHQLLAPGFPASQDAMTLVINVEWDQGESGEVEFDIHLVGPDQQPVFRIQASTEVVQDGGAPPQTRMIMPLENVVFPLPGVYEFEVSVGAAKCKTARLHLIHRAVNQQESGDGPVG